MGNKRRWYTGVVMLCAFFTWVLTLLAKRNPEKVENIYSSTVYPFLAKAIGRLTGLIPVSIAEILVFGLIILVVGMVSVTIFKPKLVVANGAIIFHVAVRTLGLAYILFYFIWGFNYYREDYAALANMSEEEPTIEDLEALTFEVINKVNNIRPNLPEDEEGVFFIEEDFGTLAELAKEGFDEFYVGDLDLTGNYGTTKPLMVSRWMSYTGITGIYIPYTVEPNVNVDIPHMNIPATICHEMGHQRGFAKEDEANFIAYYICSNHSDFQFQYSGYYLALQYLLGDLKKQDPDLYNDLRGEVNDSVNRDMAYGYHYWKEREGKAEEVATIVNDNYLKVNSQKAGVESYNQVVKLLLAEYKSR